MRFNKVAVVGLSAFALVGIVGGAVIAKTARNAAGGANELRVMAVGSMFGPRLFDKLNLTDTQRSQMRQILRDNRGSIVPLLADAHTTGKALRDASANGTSDGDLSGAEAAKQAEADTAVLAVMVQTQTKMVTVLTSDQRALAAKEIDARIAAIRGHIDTGDGPLAAMLIKLGDKLKLTDDQKAQAHQIIANSRAVTKPATMQLLDKLASTEDANTCRPERYDPATAQRRRRSGDGATHSKVVLTAATTRAKLLALLTPDQKAELQNLRRG